MKCMCEVASVTNHLFPLWVKLGLKANLRVERWVQVGRAGAVLQNDKLPHFLALLGLGGYKYPALKSIVSIISLY